jgi:hypothetical protein
LNSAKTVKLCKLTVGQIFKTMRKASLFLLLSVITLPAICQDAQDELQMIQSLFGNRKDSIVGGFVKVEGASKTKFWNLYNKFEQERRDLGQKRFRVLNNYVKSYNTLPHAELDEIMNEIISLSASQDKLIASYYKKIKKECGVAVAAQFYQIEWYLLSQVRTAVLENIPIFNELDKRK